MDICPVAHGNDTVLPKVPLEMVLETAVACFCVFIVDNIIDINRRSIGNAV